MSAIASAAVLCLALGIGAATTIASIVNTVLLQPLPYPGSERLVHVTEYVPPAAPGSPVVPARIPHSDVLDWGAQAGTLSDAFALQEIGQRLVRTRNGPVGLWGAATTTNMFRMLGVHAMHGRTFDDADVNDPDVAVLSFDAWRRHFLRRPETDKETRSRV